MNIDEKREIITRLKSICMWSLFLIGATIFWYLPRNQFAKSMATSLQSESFYLEEINNGFQLYDVFPTSDNSGMKQDALEFKIVNKLDMPVEYEVYFQNDITKLSDPNKALTHNYLRYQVVKNGSIGTIQNLSSDGKISVGTTSATSSDHYELRVWLDQEADMGALEKEFNGVLFVDTASVEW